MRTSAPEVPSGRVGSHGGVLRMRRAGSPGRGEPGTAPAGGERRGRGPCRLPSRSAAGWCPAGRPGAAGTRLWRRCSSRCRCRRAPGLRTSAAACRAGTSRSPCGARRCCRYRPPGGGGGGAARGRRAAEGAPLVREGRGQKGEPPPAPARRASGRRRVRGAPLPPRGVRRALGRVAIFWGLLSVSRLC